MENMIIMQGSEARSKLKSGVNKLNEITKHTLGPKGKHILLGSKWARSAEFSDDGKTIADHFKLKDEVENAGAEMAKIASEKTNRVAGDGTTTSISLINALVNELLKSDQLILTDSERELRKEVLEAKDLVIKYLNENKIEITTKEQVEDIGTISSGDPTVGKVLGEIYEKLGKDGVTTHQEGGKVGITYEVTQGMKIESGMLSPYMATDREKLRTKLTNATVLVVEQDLTSPSQLQTIAAQMKAKNITNFLLVCDSMTDSLVDILAINAAQGRLMLTVKSPYYGERRHDALEDIALLTGGKVVKDVAELKGDEFGKVEVVECSMQSTVLIGGAGDENTIADRASMIRNLIEESDSDFRTQQLKERLAKLVGGIAVVKVGMQTEAEQKSKMAKVEDAINAVKSALEDGIIGGGGTPLLKAGHLLATGQLGGNTNVPKGHLVLANALEAPFVQILENCGWPLDEVMQKVMVGNGQFGFNAATGEYRDLIEMGVIDPVKVTKTAVSNAVSVALMIYSSEGLIIPENEKEKESE